MTSRPNNQAYILPLNFPDEFRFIELPDDADLKAAFLPLEEPQWYILYNRILEPKLDWSPITGDVLYIPLQRYVMHDRYLSMFYFFYHLFHERKHELPENIDRVQIPYKVIETPEGPNLWIGVAFHVPKK